MRNWNFPPMQASSDFFVRQLVSHPEPRQNITKKGQLREKGGIRYESALLLLQELFF